MNEGSWPRHKRFRGAKRYYENLEREARGFSYSLKEGEWYDMHHHHFDFFGHGRRGVKHHRAHLNALFTAFRCVLADVRLSGRPAQVFVYVAPNGSPEGDALFIHTPNPHGTFPHDFDGVEWDVPPPAYLREFISGEAWQVGAAQSARRAATSFANASRHSRVDTRRACDLPQRSRRPRGRVGM